MAHLNLKPTASNSQSQTWRRVKPGSVCLPLGFGTETSDFDGVVGDGTGVAGVDAFKDGVFGTATTEA